MVEERPIEHDSKSHEPGSHEPGSHESGLPESGLPESGLPESGLPVRDFHNHARDWRGYYYVYPVLSRRSRGLSIGINLNPDAACNFDCIYCQVDRSIAPRVRVVDLAVLEVELDAMLAAALDGSLFDTPEFRDTPVHLRRVNDIAFSGDGEPTTCPQFREVVSLVAEIKERHLAGTSCCATDEVKLVLITDACYLTRPNVVASLEVFDRANGVVWAKLDAGTEGYYQLVNRPNYPLEHVMENIIATAQRRPIVIQSLFMRVHDEPPPQAEIEAYVDRLCDITRAGGAICEVLVYTVARAPAERFVAALNDGEVDAIAEFVRDKTGLSASAYYS